MIISWKFNVANLRIVNTTLFGPVPNIDEMFSTSPVWLGPASKKMSTTFHPVMIKVFYPFLLHME